MALEVGQRQRSKSAEAGEVQVRLNLLTPREKQVLDQLVAGKPNKVAAHALGISPRTIEIHRARIMSKMVANSLSDLVRAVLTVAPQP
jgi:two-component system response regulator FixJ